MFQSASNLVKRHKRKILVATGLVAGGYFVIDYVKNKFFELQDRLATERQARENLKRRFEQNQEDATFTIMALLPSLASQIMEKYPVEKITQELQAKRTERIATTAAIANEAVTNGTPSLNDSVQTLPSETSGNTPIPANSSSPAVANEGNTTNASTGPSAPASLTGSWSVTEDAAPVVKKTKTELWRDLKIRSIARAMTLVYCSALLVFFTRLQLNILGRKNYVASVIHMAESRTKQQKLEQEENAYGAYISEPTEEDLVKLALEEEEVNINRMYLTFSWWLLNKGWAALSERIEDAVTDVFDSVNPRTDLSLAEISDLIGQVQFKIDHPISVLESNNFINNLLPPTELESYVLSQAPVNPDNLSTLRSADNDENLVTPPLRRLLDETYDFIESPNAIDVIQRLVHSGLTVFVESISTIYPPGGADAEPSKVKLASILANVTRQGHALAAGKPLDPNEYILAMINVPELDGFSALVYSNFGTSSE
ncbi:Pex3p [Sugiyamaella lignohabitans]|uniref:Peroxin-3 n=1 Tax=Sugiyamaella lignohabitans TaxID=796027 RepID=A0A167CQR9_9ASCO|nr:Pex3p [Sugiyamaella lignohabitans]ANB11994.1 Pex3p [Sugiyamaella lignohabitans]